MTSRGHLSSETLDLLHLGALPPEQTAPAEAHLAACEACRARREQLAADAARFSQYVLPRTLPAVERRARGAAPWRWWVPGLALAAALVALVVVVGGGEPVPGVPGTGDAPGYVAARGGGTLRLVAQRGGRQLTVEPDTVLRAGDRLRFQVDPAGARHLLVLSRDGAGQWTVYFPYGGARSARVEGGQQLLPGSIELDATGGTEHIVAVFSERPLESSRVLQALQAGRWPPGKAPAVPGASAVQLRRFQKE